MRVCEPPKISQRGTVFNDISAITLLLYSYEYIHVVLIFMFLLIVYIEKMFFFLWEFSAAISMSDTIFTLVQYQIISFLHCYYSEAYFAIKSLFPTFLAHLSRRLTGELIVYPCSVVRRPSVRCPSFTISKIFSSETARPIKAKLHVQHP